MSTLGIVHLVFSLLSLVAGGLVLATAKGTRNHRRLGWLYVYSMLSLNVTALFLYRLNGTFGPFHWAAIVSLLGVGAGVAVAIRRRPAGKWIELHYHWMTWSYVGLSAAAVAEVMTRLIAPGFWWTVAVSSLAVFVVGGGAIRRYASRALAPWFRREHKVDTPTPAPELA